MGIITYWQRESTVLVLEASIKFSTLTFEYTSDANVTPCHQSNARNRGVGVPLLPFSLPGQIHGKDSDITDAQ